MIQVSRASRATAPGHVQPLNQSASPPTSRAAHFASPSRRSEHKAGKVVFEVEVPVAGLEAVAVPGLPAARLLPFDVSKARGRFRTPTISAVFADHADMPVRFGDDLICIAGRNVQRASRAETLRMLADATESAAHDMGLEGPQAGFLVITIRRKSMAASGFDAILQDTAFCRPDATPLHLRRSQLGEDDDRVPLTIAGRSPVRLNPPSPKMVGVLPLQPSRSSSLRMQPQDFGRPIASAGEPNQTSNGGTDGHLHPSELVEQPPRPNDGQDSTFDTTSLATTSEDQQRTSALAEDLDAVGVEAGTALTQPKTQLNMTTSPAPNSLLTIGTSWPGATFSRLFGALAAMLVSMVLSLAVSHGLLSAADCFKAINRGNAMLQRASAETARLGWAVGFAFPTATVWALSTLCLILMAQWCTRRGPLGAHATLRIGGGIFCLRLGAQLANLDPWAYGHLWEPLAAAGHVAAAQAMEAMESAHRSVSATASLCTIEAASWVNVEPPSEMLVSNIISAAAAGLFAAAATVIGNQCSSK